MEYVLIIIAFIILITGIGGAVLPVLPGPPIAFVGMLVFHFAGEAYRFDTSTILIYAALAIIITILDYVVPAYGTKKLGGSKWGSRGAVVGLIAAVFVLPVLGIALGPFGLFGIILGPFLGAVVGELMHGRTSDEALRSGFGSFVGFLAGTFLKFAYALIVTGLCIYKLF